MIDSLTISLHEWLQRNTEYNNIMKLKTVFEICIVVPPLGIMVHFHINFLWIVLLFIIVRIVSFIFLLAVVGYIVVMKLDIHPLEKLEELNDV